MTLLMYHVKDETGEYLIFNIKRTQSGQEILKFGMEQVIKLITQDIAQQKVTFFIVDEKFVPKPGQILDKNILNKCAKLFINDAAVDSLRQMVTHMNNHHKRMKDLQLQRKENDEKALNKPEAAPATRSIKSINLDQDLQKLNRKRKLRALMSGNSKAISMHLQQEKKVRMQIAAPPDDSFEIGVSILPKIWFIISNSYQKTLNKWILLNVTSVNCLKNYCYEYLTLTQRLI